MLNQLPLILTFDCGLQVKVWSTPQPCGIITLALWIANDSPTRD
jgi:hypothetical protein